MRSSELGGGSAFAGVEWTAEAGCPEVSAFRLTLPGWSTAVPVSVPEPEPVAEPVAEAPAEPDPAEIGAPPVAPKRGWWRRG